MGRSEKPADRRRPTAARRETGPLVHLAVPDGPTAGHVRAALEAAGLEAVVLGRGAAVPEDARALLLAPGGSPASRHLAEARAVSDRGGAVCCWSTGAPATVEGDDWIAFQILAQNGAFVSPSLPVLATALRLWFALGGPGGVLGAVRLRGKPSGLKTRLLEALARAGVPLTQGRAPGAIELLAGDDGTVAIAKPGGRPEPAGAIDELAGALALLRSRGAILREAVSVPAVDTDIVGQIVRPPSRLLSEVASKRLLFAAGIRAPAERLCGSASDAARFAAEIDGPVVLKLVRPGLEGKAAAGAVITGVSGAATVRRAYHELARLGEELGPPRPLGVLVAATVGGGSRLWCVARRHPAFGWVLLLGPGDAPASAPARALAMPLGPGRAWRALAELLPAAGEPALRAMDMALAGLSALIGSGGELLGRIEIHPLVVPDGGAEAVALDAIAGIEEIDRSRGPLPW
jgi:hypothetical protein